MALQEVLGEVKSENEDAIFVYEVDRMRECCLFKKFY